MPRMRQTSSKVPSRNGEVRRSILPSLQSAVPGFVSNLSFLGLDFTSLVSNLDNTASEIVTFQRDSTVQRKDLAQKTKDFRKLDDATKLGEIKGLLKGTQHSIPCQRRLLSMWTNTAL